MLIVARGDVALGSRDVILQSHLKVLCQAARISRLPIEHRSATRVVKNKRRFAVPEIFGAFEMADTVLANLIDDHDHLVSRKGNLRG